MHSLTISKNSQKNRYMMFVASHKHEHLKGLIGQRGPLCLQDVLALAEGPCVMVPNSHPPDSPLPLYH
jgi:hypothetical protein